MILALCLGRDLLRMRRALNTGVRLGQVGEERGDKSRLSHLEWRYVILYQNTEDLTETPLSVSWFLGKMIHLSRESSEDGQCRVTRAKALSEVLFQKPPGLVPHPDLHLLPCLLVAGSGYLSWRRRLRAGPS